MLVAAVALLVAVPTASQAGVATLAQSTSPTSGYTGNNFSYCGSGTRNFRIAYEYSPGCPTCGGPTPTCGANPYRIRANLYLNNNLIYTNQYQVSQAWANFYLYNQALQPGNYTATVTIEKRNWTCIGWSTVETKYTNLIVSSAAAATPNFTINGIPPTADGSPINVCASNITMHAAATSCENHYFVGIQESDRWWSRSYEYEWGRWFAGQAPNGMNLQQFSTTFSYSPYYTGLPSRQGSPLIGGNLTNGNQRYYRVNLCTGEPSWNCKTALISVNGNCLAANADDKSPPELSSEEPNIVEEEKGPVPDPMPEPRPPSGVPDSRE
jgi:hypothetical protein